MYNRVQFFLSKINYKSGVFQTALEALGLQFFDAINARVILSINGKKLTIRSEWT